MANLIGQSLGRYHILEQLGEGGMAVVYKAFDTRLERNVAIKVILPSKEQSEKFLKRFEREAKALAQLSHPNIVKVIDYGEHEGLPYLVMEYLHGGTLKKKLAGRPMPWQEATRILVPIARALAYAHEHKIVHRDVKPSNILITDSGEPMLSDFGIAKILETEETLDLTGTGVGVGTPEYMSPEQAQGKAVDARSDIYSLGIVFYEMVTGRKPYQADTPMAVIYKLASEPLPRPRQFSIDLPNEIEQVLLKLLARQPEDRYVDFRAFITALEKLERGGIVHKRTLPVISKRFRRITLSALGLVVVILAIALLAPSILTKIKEESAKSTQPVTASAQNTNNQAETIQAPTPYVAQSLTIPARSNLGITFQVSQSGLYVFRYADSAYSFCPGCEWSTEVNGFRGEKVQWNANSLNYDAALFTMNNGAYPSSQAAINAARSDQTSISLHAGDFITLVLGDGKTYYEDNSGEVVLDVLFTPAGNGNEASGNSLISPVLLTAASPTKTPAATKTPALNSSISNTCTDEFDKLPDWQKDIGSWRIDNGRLCIQGDFLAFSRCSDNLASSNYKISLYNAILSKPQSLDQGYGFGVFFRVKKLSNGINGYIFQYDPGLNGFLYRKWIRGVEGDPFAQVTQQQSYGWYDVPRNIQITVEGTSLKTSVDGKLVLSKSDSSYREGVAGIRTWGDGVQLCLDRFSVETIP